MPIVHGDVIHPEDEKYMTIKTVVITLDERRHECS